MRGNRKSKRDSGQVAILFALVFSFMFVLFCFVVNFAHLINTKMNLQIAADSAAYAGAAWQARTLNKIGLINYRMRQNLKEFAMKVQVTHLRHNRNYPRGGAFLNGGDGPPAVEPFLCQQAHSYRGLSGLRYAIDTNLCAAASPTTGGLPPIIVPPVIASFDPFAVAIAAQIRRIADAANQECKAAANDNRVLATHLINAYTQRSQQHFNQLQQMVQFLNGQFDGGTQLKESDSHPIRKVAFQSFFKNLAFTNRAEDFALEIVPVTGGSVMDVQAQRINGSIFFVDFTVVGDGCVGKPSFVDFNDMIGGVSKIQEIITYFAVKARVKPKLFFMPQAWGDAFPELVAYAAAKPFGSRIGPTPNFDILTPVADRPGNNNRMLNFSFVPGDQLGILNTKRMAFLDLLHPASSIGRSEGSADNGWPDASKPGVNKAPLRAIRAPSQFDALFFTIFPDPGPTSLYEESDIAQFLYPDNMEASDANGQALSPAFLNSAGAGGPPFVPIAANGVNGGTPYGDYASEDNQSHSVPLAEQIPEFGGNAGAFGWANRAQVHSGWAPDGAPGRIGYSVKFVSFDTLTRALIVRGSGGGQTRIANPPDPSFDIDLTPARMLH